MAGKFQIIPLGKEAEWNDSLHDVPHSFTHTHEYCKAMHFTTDLDTFLFVYKYEGIKIICPLTERFISGYVEITKTNGITGFTGNGFHPGFNKAWIEFVKGNNYVTGYLGVHPLFEQSSLFPKNDQFHYTDVYCLDLTPPLESILSGMSRKRRKEIKQERLTDNLVSEKTQFTHFFIDHYDEFLHYKKASKDYYLTPETIAYLIKSENVYGIGFSENGQLTSVLLFAKSPYLGDSLIYCSLPGENKQSAILYWDNILKLKYLGIPTLNLGGATSSGLVSFKKRFGATSLPMFSVKQIYRKDVYKKLCYENNVNPDVTNEYFPPYHSKM